MGMTTGQLIGTVAGGIIGAVIPGGGMLAVSIGMAVGGLIGGWIDPPPAPDPPPLGNLGLNTYIHNAPITLAYGQCKIYGGCIWIGDMGTSMANHGSKKNPEYTPRMWLEFAIAHCEGPVSAYLKYWVNDKTVNEINEDGMTFSINRYYGTDTQGIEPVIENYLAGSDSPAIPWIWTAYSYVYAIYDGGYFTTIPNFSAEIKALLCEPDEEDANPIKVLYDFMTNIRYGAAVPAEWFDGDPYTEGSSWKIASDYCDELVSYLNEDLDTIYEPRFRYSNGFTNRNKGYDIIKNILQTCRGIIAYCQGKLYVKIENESEEVSGYYSDEYIVDLISTGDSTVDRIYFTTTITEPSGFWEGAYLNFEFEDVVYSEMINVQGTDYVDLVESLPFAPDADITIHLTKDNIKEGSFTWNKKSKLERYHTIRIEFCNRKWIDDALNELLTNEYLWDVVEWEQPETYIDMGYYGVYASYIYYNPSMQQIRLEGVSRKAQAMRMAKWYADFSSYIDYYSEFSVDQVGYRHKIGDIIAIRHSMLGWENKEFRIVAMEEIDNDEIKLKCMEYNRNIYGDEVLQVRTSHTSTIPSPYGQPDNIIRLHVAQDAGWNRIYINFERPTGMFNNWWSGVQLWIKKGINGTYQNVAFIGTTTPSIKLSSAIDDIQTIIPFDIGTLFGTFPNNRTFWIESELISYGSINETLDQFENCVRGSNAVSHVETEYCHLHDNEFYTVPFIYYYPSDIGTTWYFKAISVTTVGTPADWDEAMEVSLTLV